MAKKKPTTNENTTETETTIAEEPPILTGREGDDTFTTVTLIGGGPGDGTFRVAAVTQTLISQGAMYVLSNRETGTYTWRHP